MQILQQSKMYLEWDDPAEVWCDGEKGNSRRAGGREPKKFWPISSEIGRECRNCRKLAPIVSLLSTFNWFLVRRASLEMSPKSRFLSNHGEVSPIITPLLSVCPRRIKETRSPRSASIFSIARTPTVRFPRGITPKKAADGGETASLQL